MLPAAPPNAPHRAGPVARLVATALAAAFGFLIFMALAVAALSAAVIGAILALGFLALRGMAMKHTPPREADGQTLDGRRTAEGWIVEARANG